MAATGKDDWEEVWDARIASLSQVLGPTDDRVYHAVHPFALGGQADVLAFPHHLNGVVYVTAELTGKADACYADYELMICHRTATPWGANVISRLARYTQEAYIGAGETMDIDPATPSTSKIKAFLFDTYATFKLFGQDLELRLCLGITKAELRFKMENGSEKLLALLKRQGIYPFTDLDRETTTLDA
jgi:hypothetical protein